MLTYSKIFIHLLLICKAYHGETVLILRCLNGFEHCLIQVKAFLAIIIRACALFHFILI